MDDKATALLGRIASAERLSASAAALAVMQRYPVALRTRRSWPGYFIMSQFTDYEKKITHDQVAPVLGLPSPLSLPPLPIYRSRLPLHAIKRVCQQIDSSRVAHRDDSFSWGYRRCRPRYLTALFIALLDAFGGMIHDDPSRIPDPPDLLHPPAMVEHRLKAFGATALLVMVEVRIRTHPREDIVARLLAECEARDFENHQLGYWLPLIGVHCDRNHLQFFLYDSSDRRFYASEPLTHFPEHRTELEFLMSIRIVAERFHDLFLLCLINGMRSHISCIEPAIMLHGYFGVPVMNNFRSSLSIAEAALETARRAADMAEAVKATDPIERLHEAETLAEHAYEELKKSFHLGPVGGCVRRHMGGWDDEKMMRC